MSININLININYLISVAKVKTNNNNKNGPNKFKRTHPEHITKLANNSDDLFLRTNAKR